MATTYSQKSSNIQKTWFLMVFFFALVMGFGFIMSEILETRVIFYFAVVLATVGNFYAYWFSDKLALKMTNSKKASRKEYFDTWNSLENLSITAGLPMPTLYVIADDAPNAFATGRDPKHSAVVVTTGILKMLDKNEMEGVLAHELSHIQNRDTLVMTVSVVLLGLVAILAEISFHARFAGRGNNSLMTTIIVIVAVVVAPIITKILHLAISRKREFLADASGAHLTRYPEALASALEKISGYGGMMKKNSAATAHLFIISPLAARDKNANKKEQSMLEKLFSTHPPVTERVAKLRSFA